MPFTVETGSGASNSNSYVSVSDADAYHSLYNNTAWAALTTAAKQAGLLYATAYIDANFSFGGVLSNSEQALSWPRSDAWDLDGRQLTGIPQKLKDATCELALVHATTEAINSTFERGGAVKSESVGSVSVTYMDSAGAGVTYPFLTSMLASLSTVGGVGITRIVRS